jgi:Holliday junction resolvasome RuvABC DNA-binding subunit
MYSYLRGSYKGQAPGGDGAILLEVAGIGFEVILPPIVEGEISGTCQPDDPLLLHVSAQAGRDQPWPVLFGFLRAEERAFWELLKSVPRVGGKGAARAMVVPIEQIAGAIQSGNRAFLDGLPGITLDGADKIIAALRKKVGPFVETSTEERRRGPRTEADEIRDDAVALLAQMGLKRADAVRAVTRLMNERDDIASVQDIVTEYFRQQRESRARSSGAG